MWTDTNRTIDGLTIVKPYSEELIEMQQEKAGNKVGFMLYAIGLSADRGSFLAGRPNIPCMEAIPE